MEGRQLHIFDWSGTLSDDRRPVHQACVSLGRHYNAEPHYKFEDWLANTQASPHAYLKVIGVEADKDEVFQVYTRFFNEAHDEGVVPTMYPDVPFVLESLKEQGTKLAVVSTHPKELLMREAQGYRLSGYFEDIIGHSLSKAESIAGLCKNYGLTPPDQVIYIGDTTSDVKAAKEAKVHAAAVTYGYHSREKLQAENPDSLWDDLKSVI